VFGDRASRLVLIGIKLDKGKLTGSLDECLLTETGMAEDWSKLIDNFPGSH
jgi:hypothetical protein